MFPRPGISVRELVVQARDVSYSFFHADLQQKKELTRDLRVIAPDFPNDFRDRSAMFRSEKFKSGICHAFRNLFNLNRGHFVFPFS
jgi:hypothetical protein